MEPEQHSSTEAACDLQAGRSGLSQLTVTQAPSAGNALAACHGRGRH